MTRRLLRGFPDGAIRMGSTLSVLKKFGRVTYFVGSDNGSSHPASDLAGRRFAIVPLIADLTQTAFRHPETACACSMNWLENRPRGL